MSAQNIKIGAVKAWFKGEFLGKTKGGATITYSPEMRKLIADQWGETPLDYAVVGEMIQITLRLTEESLANWGIAIPAGTLAGGDDGRLTLGQNAGKRLGAEAGQLILHPMAFADNDPSMDLVLHKAVSMEEVAVEKNNDDQTVWEITMIALVDETKSNGNWLGFIGDSTD